MPIRPTTGLPRFASQDFVDAGTGNNNVIEPPEEKKDRGWNAGEVPPRNYFNWMHRQTFLWLEYLAQEDAKRARGNGNGVGVAPLDNSMIILFAIDKTAPTHFLVAFGYRGTGAATMNVIANNTLTIGSTSGNNITISGATGGNASNILVQTISQTTTD